MEATRKIIRKPELFSIIGLSDATIWRLEKNGDFPRRVKIGGAAVGWFSDEVDNWMSCKAEERIPNLKEE